MSKKNHDHCGTYGCIFILKAFIKNQILIPLMIIRGVVGADCRAIRASGSESSGFVSS